MAPQNQLILGVMSCAKILFQELLKSKANELPLWKEETRPRGRSVVINTDSQVSDTHFLKRRCSGSTKLASPRSAHI